MRQICQHTDSVLFAVLTAVAILERFDCESVIIQLSDLNWTGDAGYTGDGACYSALPPWHTDISRSFHTVKRRGTAKHGKRVSIGNEMN